MTGRDFVMNPRTGKTQHCVFEGCKSDSRYGAPVDFMPFPKACLAVRRKLIEGDKAHLSECVLCQKCKKWINCCKRKDGRFNHLLHVNEHKYICKKHFVADGPSEIYSMPLPEVEVNKIRNSGRNRRLNETLAKKIKTDDTFHSNPHEESSRSNLEVLASTAVSQEKILVTQSQGASMDVKNDSLTYGSQNCATQTDILVGREASKHFDPNNICLERNGNNQGGKSTIKITDY